MSRFEPISEIEQALLMQGLNKLLRITPDKEGTITVGTADKQFVTSANTVEAVIAALGKMIPDQTNVFGDVLERKALRCCTGYLRSLTYSLTNSVLPEYDRRMLKASGDPLLKAKYMGYVIAAKDKLEIANKLLSRMERAL
jgi:hypothetical protein